MQTSDFIFKIKRNRCGILWSYESIFIKFKQMICGVTWLMYRPKQDSDADIQLAKKREHASLQMVAEMRSQHEANLQRICEQLQKQFTESAAALRQTYRNEARSQPAFRFAYAQANTAALYTQHALLICMKRGVIRRSVSTTSMLNLLTKSPLPYLTFGAIFSALYFILYACKLTKLG